ncbi:MAG: hypothetical protein ACREAJ_03650 [Nitrosopumilaceae archaeon]
MGTEDLSFWNLSSDRFVHVLERIGNQIDKITTNLISSSSPITTADKVGLVFTIIVFSVILTPIALSDTDPYHLKWIIEEVKDSVPLIEDSFGNYVGSQYTVIIHLKSSPESHLDTTEKVILGKYRTITN